MSENINLCEILRGHEGETFYCTIFGKVKLNGINNDGIGYPIEIIIKDQVIHVLDKCGRFVKDYDEGECTLFPSKDQRNWNKWIEEQKLEVPKTWSELQNKFGIQFMFTDCQEDNRGENMNIHPNNPIEKSALAFMKIINIIDVGYGGNVTNKEWKNTDFKYVIFKDVSTNKFSISSVCNCIYGLIAFHKIEQAEEFLSKPENIQLLKDYFMVNE